MFYGTINVALFIFGYFACYLYHYKPKQKALPPVNVIRGTVLPEPDDPRWWNNHVDNKHILTLGKIQVEPTIIAFDQEGPLHNYFVNKKETDNQISRYYSAICDGLAKRAAEDSILNAKMPPKRKRVKALTKKEEIEALIKALTVKEEVKALAPVKAIESIAFINGTPVLMQNSTVGSTTPYVPVRSQIAISGSNQDRFLR